MTGFIIKQHALHFVQVKASTQSRPNCVTAIQHNLCS